MPWRRRGNFKIFKKIIKSSFGTGSEIKIPGLTIKTPLSYDCPFVVECVSYKFGTEYEIILNDLIGKNKELSDVGDLYHS